MKSLHLKKHRLNTCEISLKKEIIRHSDYSSLTNKNDIALIRLLEKIYFSDLISPACLQTDLHDEKTDVKMIVTGWGKISSEGILKINSCELMTTQTCIPYLN